MFRTSNKYISREKIYETEFEFYALERIAHLIIDCVLDAGNAMIELKDEKDDEKQQEALHYHGNKYYEKYKKHDGWTFENKMKQALYRKGFSIDEIEIFLQMKREEE